MKVTLEHVEQLSSTVRTLHFRPERRLRYEAGQFIELTLPGVPEPDIGRRWFTLSSSPTEPLLAITTRCIRLSERPYKRVLSELQAGATADMSEAMGDFILPIDASRPLVFAAEGIGITPFRSMVRWLLDSGETRRVRLLYGARTSDDFLFRGLFDAAPFIRTKYIVPPAPDNSQHPESKRLSGRLTARHILSLAEPADETLYYLAGPEHLIEKVDTGLRAAGIGPESIVTDCFTGYKNT